MDRCLPPPNFRYIRFNVIEEFKQISQYEQRPLAMSSEPVTVCLCIDHSKPDCSLKELNLTKMRGESLTVTIAALDQDDNLVPSIITASYTERLSAQLKQGERSQDIANKCTELKYHIFTVLSAATLVLEPTENSHPLSNLIAYIHIVPCSRGFEQQGNACVCDRRLNNRLNITVCDIDAQSIHKRGPIWVRYDEEYLKVHANCPLDYCLVSCRQHHQPHLSR